MVNVCMYTSTHGECMHVHIQHMINTYIPFWVEEVGVCPVVGVVMQVVDRYVDTHTNRDGIPSKYTLLFAHSRHPTESMGRMSGVCVCVCVCVSVCVCVCECVCV